ncbi:MAG: hypothetical protein UV73_C0001G0001 [Candidatus Gottesmanbacteria bacterium GW2011_GWA2_43_14]|uniref:SGNH hydrolase-type esterase domain-containing protein n=1 Tax=Candidatus Gottesmanbacteria bacterium GW2011_GWA2_43_14 TaxID=1618443 RepID=A0A0G1DKT7_9BACT|nr:MAG: hypothetical protein UV73_C0001G0001 [Candidatus Gottesmanbacteria bacterium GW2011_GWA2_43_14]
MFYDIPKIAPKKIIFRILILIQGIILTLLMIDLLLKFNYLILPYNNSNGWWRWHWIHSRQKNKPEQSAYADIFDPLLGWIPQRNTRIINNNKIYTFNSIGIRSGNEFNTVNREKTRLVALGDSFVYGECVGDDETFSTLMEQNSRNLEVMNFGVHGYGLDQIYLRLKNALTYSPDIVILGLYNEEVERVRLSFREFPKPHLRLNKGRLEPDNIPLVSPDSYTGKFNLEVINFIDYAKEVLVSYYLPQLNLKKEENLVIPILNEILLLADKNDISINFIYLPLRYEVLAGKSDMHPVFQLFCSQNIVRCFDPTEFLHLYLASQLNPESHFTCHYSPEIHAQLAKFILTKIGLNYE